MDQVTNIGGLVMLVRKSVITKIVSSLLALVCTGSVAQADTLKPEVLSQPCETSLALSAAPEYLRAEATVYALKQSGYVKIRSGTNGFVCIVNRDDPRVLKPTCFDKSGAESVIPKILYRGERMMQGDELLDIQRDIDAGFKTGVFISQPRFGVAYMLSRYNRPVNPQTGELGFFPPHVMFHAPHLTNADIGHDMNHHDLSRPLPMIAYGGPQGYMIMISDDGTKRSRADLHSSCPDWIWAD